MSQAKDYSYQGWGGGGDGVRGTILGRTLIRFLTSVSPLDPISIAISKFQPPCPRPLRGSPRQGRLQLLAAPNPQSLPALGSPSQFGPVGPASGRC